MGIEVSGLFGLIVLIFNVLAIVKVTQSNSETGVKVLWIVVILILPVLGLIAWYFLGPKG